MIGLLLAVALAAPDRSAPPPVEPPEPRDLPALVDRPVTDAGVVRWLPVPGLRRVVVEVRFRRGARHLDGTPTPATDLLGVLWGTAARGWTPLALEDRLVRLDAELHGWVGARESALVLDVPREHAADALVVLGDVIRAATFPAREVRRTVREELRWYQADAPHDADALAGVIDAAWYGPDDPRGRPADLRALRRVRPAHLARRRARLVAESPVDALVIGDIDPDALAPALADVLAGIGTPGAPEPPLPARPTGVPLALAVDLPDSAEATILVRTQAPPRDHADAPAFATVAHALGGHFLSRLNRNLREDKGWTYGGGARWSPGEADGTWTFRVPVRAEHVVPALREIEAELDAVIADGLSDGEIATGATAAVAAWNAALLTADTAHDVYGELFAHGEDVGAARARLEALRAVRGEQTAEVARHWLGAPDRLVLVVGDRAVLEGPLAEALGEVRWLDPEEAALGRLEPATNGSRRSRASVATRVQQNP